MKERINEDKNLKELKLSYHKIESLEEQIKIHEKSLKSKLFKDRTNLPINGGNNHFPMENNFHKGTNRRNHMKNHQKIEHKIITDIQPMIDL